MREALTLPERARIIVGSVLLALVATSVGYAAAENAVPLCGRVLRAAESDPFEPAPADHNLALEACVGQIRPGAPMTSPYGCTFSFIFTDSTGALYTGTAGHCTDRVGQRVSTQLVGQFGSVVYRRVQGANDFALVRIDEAKRSFVNPTMCQWGGPVGVAPAGGLPKDALLEYGWGTVTMSNMVSRARVHAEFSGGGDSITWNGVGSGGDSGAPIVNAAGYAVGSHTFGITDYVGVIAEGGPTIRAMLDMGRTAVPTLTLVNGDPTNVENAMRDLTY